MTLNTIISGHDQFKDSFNKHQHHWARLVGEGQHPQVLWIGCSDSRVIPEQITAARPGDLFVMRNIANVVPPYGTTGDAASALLEYAVLELGVEDIIVCGHSYCAGVGAIVNQGSLNIASHMARWVSWIQPALSQVEAMGLPEEIRYLETIKANVLLQRRNVETYPDVRHALKANRLSVHAWLFDLDSGELMAFDDIAHNWTEISTRLAN
jgi:carbonic anhydrase